MVIDEPDAAGVVETGIDEVPVASPAERADEQSLTNSIDHTGCLERGHQDVGHRRVECRWAADGVGEVDHDRTSRAEDHVHRMQIAVDDPVAIGECVVRRQPVRGLDLVDPPEAASHPITRPSGPES